MTPPRTTEFPVLKGTITGATGHLGAFTLEVDDYALPLPLLPPAPRLRRAPRRRDFRLRPGARSFGQPAALPAPELRPGYLRADPHDPVAVERAIAEAGNLVGEFDKPRFIQFTENLCAHSRSRITGCTRCLDLCPTGAIAPAGDHVAIDAAVCAGCGACAAACPTGAASYALPPADAVIRRLRTLLQAYREAGGGTAVVLLHDGDHGEALIDALARFGDGLPANVLPLRVNEVTQVGPETVAAAFAYGAAAVRFLARAKPKHDLAGLYRTISVAATILAALGYGAEGVSVIETDDPDELRAALDRLLPGTPTAAPASFVPRGAKRGVLELSFRELHRRHPRRSMSCRLPRAPPSAGSP